jgi:hypothetical protein
MEKSETKLIRTAKELLKSFGYFVDHLWHVRDIHFICEQNNIMQLTDQEAMEIFEIANEQLDGEVGLSWPHLEQALHIHLKRKSAFITLLQKDKAAT